jgi:hypothetical protein
MTRIALSPQVARTDVKSDVILGFTFGLQSTPEMVASVEAGGVPPYISRKGSPRDWTIDVNGFNGYRSVSVPTFAYSGEYLLTAEQFHEVAIWLDHVSPGWENMTDGYGHPAVRIMDAAPQRELDEADRALDEAWQKGPGQPDRDL